MTGKTVEEAVEAALDQLGVAENDAEIVIVEEPKSGMFGLRRSGARNQGTCAPHSTQGEETGTPAENGARWRRARQPPPVRPF